MKVLLRIQDLYFLDSKPAWWQDPRYLRSVLQALDQTGLWRPFGYYGPEGSKRRKIDSLEGLVKASTVFKEKTYSLVTQDVETPAAQLDLDLKPGALTVRLGFQPAFLKDHRENLVSQLVDLVVRLKDAWGPRVVIGPLVNV